MKLAQRLSTTTLAALVLVVIGTTVAQTNSDPIVLGSSSTVIDVEDCPLECTHDTACVAGPNADFADHVLPDGSSLPFQQESEVNGYHCQCPDQWTGVLCEVPFATCQDGGQHKCYHNGECIEELVDAYGNHHHFCNCENAYDDSGNKYVGKYCESRAVNYCSPDGELFCLNGGACNDQYPNLGDPCLCPEDYTGEHCEYQKDSVPDCDLDCQNGGRCVLGGLSDEEQESSYEFWRGANDTIPDTNIMHCSCPDNYVGPLCEVSSVPCGDHHCFNGGTCLQRNVDGVTLHHCDCTTSYTDETSYAGRFCQYKATSFCTKNSGLNGHLFCVNDGTCKDDAFEGCDCNPGYTGFSCEFVKSEFETKPTTTNDGSGEGEGTTNEQNEDDVGVPVEDPPETYVCDLLCLNGGTCRNGKKELDDKIADIAQNAPHLNATVDDEDFMHCVCPDGWTGLSCEIAIQVCGEGEHLCLHGSRCVKDGQDDACDCDPDAGYVGAHCEHPVNDICTIGDPGPGEPLSFCVNGGQCKKRVASNEGHPGCTCVGDFTGPHCELRASATKPPREESPPNEPPLGGLAPNGQDAPADGPPTTTIVEEEGNGFQIFVLIISLVAIVMVTMFTLSNYLEGKKKRNIHIENSLRWAGATTGYRDRPHSSSSSGSASSPRVNLAPRRQSTREFVEVQSHASSTDPFATRLAPSSNAPKQPFEVEKDNDPTPQVYIGPPRDEDGHELHNVLI